jgi:hypothetical protein
VVCGAIVMSSGVADRGAAPSEAVELPGACANLVHASERFAREGSSAVVHINGSEMFPRDTQEDAAVFLRALLAACDDELAAAHQ